MSTKSKKIVKYALINNERKYLTLEQVSSTYIEVTATECEDLCSTFDSYREAHLVGYGMKFDTSEWKYYINEEDYPTDIVKVIKIIEIKSTDGSANLFKRRLH